MRHPRYIFSVLLFFVTSSLCAREKAVTLKSSADDFQVTIRYDVTTSDDECTIQFNVISKELESELNRKYDVDKVRVLFFETNGNYLKDKFSYKISTKALAFNSDEWTYEKHEEGYVWLDDKPELHLSVLVPETKLSIPIYLAYYKKKHTYEVISDCGLLEIPLKKSRHQESDDESVHKKTETRTITIEEEVESESELTPAQEAEILIEKITNHYDNGSMPLEWLEGDMSKLCNLQSKIKDKKLRQKIDTLFDKVKEKKREEEQEKKNAEKRAAEEEKEKQVRNNLEFLKNRLGNNDELTEKDLSDLNGTVNDLEKESLDINNQELRDQINDAIKQYHKKKKEIEDAKKRRKVWTIIGGALFAVFMFIGNQTLQHFRNLRNQKGIAEMQDRMVRRAENEARRRTQNAVRSKVNRAKNRTIDKGRETVRKGVRSSIGTIGNKTKGNGNQKYTI